jgi:hypothetical protein
VGKWRCKVTQVLANVSRVSLGAISGRQGGLSGLYVICSSCSCGKFARDWYARLREAQEERSNVSFVSWGKLPKLAFRMKSSVVSA